MKEDSLTVSEEIVQEMLEDEEWRNRKIERLRAFPKYKDLSDKELNEMVNSLISFAGLIMEIIIDDEKKGKLDNI